MTDKLILRALQGQTLKTPPVWMMRQAGRYLPEYRLVREKAGSFLDLCYNPELAAEVTLQPIRRYGFDAAIIFADILLIPHALGAELKFTSGDGPQLSTVTDPTGLANLRPIDAIHETLAPVYEAIRIAKAGLPRETTLIGFAGAPWTVATYMIAGHGTADQAPARNLMYRDPATFFTLLDLIADATAEYLIAQVDAGAEVIKLFDSWAGTVPGLDFSGCCIEPVQRILARFREVHPTVPVIGFPRGSGGNYVAYSNDTHVQGLALDTAVSGAWARTALPISLCLQGNLDPLLLEFGGAPLRSAAQRIVAGFSGRPHIFNLGHGVTPRTDPTHIDQMLKAIRG